MVTIEPIKNQYLTALKERQQIIDKLNEIISGLNALNFDDLTTIQAELVAIRESLQTQNTAITEINNSIGQIKTELTSFDNRLITLNTNIEDTKSNLNSFENDTALNLQSKVNKNGDTMTGNLGIPTTTTGARNNLAVNGERLQNDLDNYAPMVRTTGNKVISGVTEFIDSVFGSSYYGIVNKKADFSALDRTTNKRAWLMFLKDSEDRNLIRGFYDNSMDGTNQFILSMALYDTDGTSKEVTILRIVTDSTHNITTVQVGGKTI